MPSLFDHCSFQSDSEDSDEDEENISHPEAARPLETDALSLQPPTPLVSSRLAVYDVGFPKPPLDELSISSVAASFGGESASSEGRGGSTPLRPNPILQLDEVEEEEDIQKGDAKRFKPISIAQRAQATSRLICPLADVVQTMPRSIAHQAKSSVRAHQDELQVYHLTRASISKSPEAFPWAWVGSTLILLKAPLFASINLQNPLLGSPLVQ